MAAYAFMRRGVRSPASYLALIFSGVSSLSLRRSMSAMKASADPPPVFLFISLPSASKMTNVG